MSCGSSHIHKLFFYLMEELPNQKHMVVEEWDNCDIIDSMGLGFALGKVVIKVFKVMIAVITLF